MEDSNKEITDMTTVTTNANALGAVLFGQTKNTADDYKQREGESEHFYLMRTDVNYRINQYKIMRIYGAAGGGYNHNSEGHRYVNGLETWYDRY